LWPHAAEVQRKALAAADEAQAVSEALPPTFTITLRRADKVFLGLDVRGDPGSPSLTVEAIRAGGAVEAWNRQCAGTDRVILRGDKIIAVNEAKEASAMRAQCKQRLLLKVTVFRDSAAPVASGMADSPLRSASRSCRLRAEADEFVP